MERSRRSTGDPPGAVAIRRDTGVGLVAPPGKGELAGGPLTGRVTTPRGRVTEGVVTGEQADPPSLDEGLVGLVGTGCLGADDRGTAVAVVDGQQ